MTTIGRQGATTEPSFFIVKNLSLAARGAAHVSPRRGDNK